MSVSLDQILSQIEQKIQDVKARPELQMSGEIVSLGDGVAKLTGLRGVSYGELIRFESGAEGVVLNLDQHFVSAIILRDFESLREGMVATANGQLMTVPVGDAMLGRVVDALGRPLDGQGPLQAQQHFPIERVASGVMSRKSVHEPLQTGIKAIDALVPIGRGQRELIIGDRQTGKTQIAIDTIVNQKGQNMKCIYVAIGQKDSKIVTITEELRRRGALEYTTIVVAGASSPAAMQWIAPYAGCAMGEYFMMKGEHALIIYDDLSKHANAYREISLLLRRPPGREAYPGDVFYLHSRLLERAAKQNDALGAGSLTALPIIETQAGDVSAYIPTNVISITDGQIFLESQLFHSGVRPAINVGLSVSRVGGSAQTKAMKKVAGPLKLQLAQFRELEVFAQFASDLDEDVKKQLHRGRSMVEILKQGIYAPVPFEKQVCILWAGNAGYLDKVAQNRLGEFEQEFYNKLDTEKTLLEKLRAEKALSPEMETSLQQLTEEAIRLFV